MRIRKRKASAQPFDKRRVGRGVRKLSLVILRGGGLGRAYKRELEGIPAGAQLRVDHPVGHALRTYEHLR